MDLTEALNIQSEQVKRPPNLPVGTYRFMVNKLPQITDSKNDEYKIFTFPCVVQEAMEDVNPEELQAFGPLQNVFRQYTFLYPKDNSKERDQQAALYKLNRFLAEHLKVELGTIKEMMDKAQGHVFLAQVGTRPDKNDPEMIYEDIKGTAPVE